MRENNRKIAQSDARTLRGIERTFQEVDEIKPKKAGRRKIEPGTPHPTDPNKVRSNNGRWVTKAYYDKVNKALAGAEEIKFDQWRENPPEKYKKIGNETDDLNQEIIKAYKVESDQDLNVLLKKISNEYYTTLCNSINANST